MTILRIINREMDRDTYDTMRTMLDLDHQHPIGLIMHGVTEVDGKILVAQVWESSWYARRFDEDVLAPVVEAAGAPRRTKVAVFELEHLVTP